MTAVEMQILFQDIVETATKNNQEKWYPISHVIFEYITEAQSRFFNERYLSGTFVERTNFLRVHRNEVLPLVETSTLLDTSIDAYVMYENAYTISWDINEEFVSAVLLDYRHTELQAATGGIKIELQPVEGDITRYVTTHINKPVIMQPVIHLLSNNKAMIIVDNYSSIGLAGETEGGAGDKLTLYLLSKPERIQLSNDGSGDCVLQDRFHETIVRMAASQILQDKFGIQLQENTNRQQREREQ